MLIDQRSGELLSAGSAESKASLVARGPSSVQSIANHVMVNENIYCYPPVRLAHLNAAIFPKGLNTSASLNASTRQQVWHLSFLFNAEVDLPLNYWMGRTQPEDGNRPGSYLAQLVLGADN